jgi:hypothetical protein
VLELRTDSFAGRTDCRVRRGRLSYERQAQVVHLPARLNTFDAAYRIDGGRLMLARDAAADLAAQGFALSDDDLQNPSGGLVRISAAVCKAPSWCRSRPGPASSRCASAWTAWATRSPPRTGLGATGSGPPNADRAVAAA